jgi:hypothetical protein
MGVAKEQRGQQVQCPHCYKVVQAPAPVESPAALAPAGPEAAFTAPAPAPTEEKLPAPDGTGGNSGFGFVPAISEPAPAAPDSPTSDRAESSDFATDEAGPIPSGPALHYGHDTLATANELPADSLPAAPRPRRPERKSLLVPILLIFLVPYSITITAFLAWYIYHQNQAHFDPLERLPDPKAGKGGAERIHPDSPLPPKLKTSLRQPLQIGQLEITPLRIDKDDQGRLGLYLKLRNISGDVAFDPILPNEEYRFRRVSMRDSGPYTYLETGDRHLYMLGVETPQTPSRPEGKRFDGVLQPGEEMVAVLRTQADDRGVLHGVASGLVWRVQLRRGLVAVRDTEISATAVIGVVFDMSAVGAAGPDHG